MILLEFILLTKCIQTVKVVETEPHVKVGAQASYYELKGAYTGAVAASMLSTCGVNYVLVGVRHHFVSVVLNDCLRVSQHSERRAIFGESNVEVGKSLQRILKEKMVPILCIGETKEEYELGLCNDVCTVQLNNALRGLSSKEVSKVVIAYEPIWSVHDALCTAILNAF